MSSSLSDDEDELNEVDDNDEFDAGDFALFT